jgi:hypothetical protein
MCPVETATHGKRTNSVALPCLNLLGSADVYIEPVASGHLAMSHRCPSILIWLPLHFPISWAFVFQGGAHVPGVSYTAFGAGLSSGVIADMPTAECMESSPSVPRQLWEMRQRYAPRGMTIGA